MEQFQLYRGDCLEVMASLELGSVDLTVTSPPYDNMRDYKGTSEDWGEDKWKEVIEGLFRVTKVGGAVVWNVNDKTIGGAKTCSSFRQALCFVERGFFLADTMIWEKSGTSMGSQRLYYPNYEFMFVFSKGKHRTFNPIKDRKNVVTGSQTVGPGGLGSDGVSEKKKGSKTITSANFGKRNNIWKYNPSQGSNKHGHPAPFPLPLAEDHIRTWSNPTEVVFDPFLGSGTTGVAAANLYRKFVGCERVGEYFDVAKERIEKGYSESLI